MKDFNSINRVMGTCADDEHKPMHISMQYFAEGGDGDADDKGGDKGDDDLDDDDDKPSDKSKKGFTQEEVDALIEKRLARERKKAEKAKADAETDKTKTAEQKAKEKAEKDAKAQADKITALEQKTICYDADVPRANVGKVIKLANAYIDDDTDFEEAVSKVKEEFPFLFKDGEEDEEEEKKPGTTGVKTKGGKKDVDGVMAAFYAKNPDLKKS